MLPSRGPTNANTSKGIIARSSYASARASKNLSRAGDACATTLATINPLSDICTRCDRSRRKIRNILCDFRIQTTFGIEKIELYRLNKFSDIAV